MSFIMGVHPNPHYAADCASRIATAEARYARALMQCDAAMASGFGSAAHRAALEFLTTAKATLHAARLTRFRTIADYAAWLFDDAATNAGEFAVIPDFDAFTSIEEAEAAHERALRHRREGTLERKSRLDTGQPPGLAAFAEAEAVISTWRLFGNAETCIECMVSFQQIGDKFHICLAHPWGALTGHSNEAFRRIATQLARESILLHSPATAPVFLPDGHRRAQNRELIREVNALAASFQFYRHLLPGHGLREEFARVDMGWDGATFYDPDWSAMVFATLPETLRAAAAASPTQLMRGDGAEARPRFPFIPESRQIGGETSR
ncbi:hypothetical protein [Acidocella sp. KAb 2-4]|uniref:hypothetical protein n=1 Tax=Acidocella sp. KAb 2-4 TaxID=2885158 RepID=UPI001D07605E|nr:hypothetical protein [Acidocella sp. KAb 2-4]MCB5945233.1 hypothetical protein [Acidocella sp. KAb 2-4]